MNHYRIHSTDALVDCFQFSTVAATLRRFALKPLLLLAFACLACLPTNAANGHPDSSGWDNLFTANLSNAELTEDGWSQKKGVLVARDHFTIWTKKSYTNFVLDLEFKVAKESNSGVFLRSGNTAKVLEALEVQVHESQDAALYGMVGAIYNAQPPSKAMQKPIGEWNRYTITCKGKRLSLVFNGTQVWNINLDDWNESRKNPDGTKNKFPTALKDYARKGPIGLQGLHGKAQAPVWYRNIRIKELK